MRIYKDDHKPAASAIVSLALSLSCVAWAIAAPTANESLKRSQDLYNTRKYTQAIATLDKAIEQDSHLQRAFFLRAQSKEKLNKYDQAIDDYTQCVQIKPDDLQSYMHMSSCWTKLGKYNVAVSCLSKALLLNPKDAAIYKARADAYDKLGEHANATTDRDVARALARAGHLK